MAYVLSVGESVYACQSFIEAPIPYLHVKELTNIWIGRRRFWYKGARRAQILQTVLEYLRISIQEYPIVREKLQIMIARKGDIEARAFNLGEQLSAHGHRLRAHLHVDDIIDVCGVQ